MSSFLERVRKNSALVEATDIYEDLSSTFDGTEERKSGSQTSLSRHMQPSHSSLKPRKSLIPSPVRVSVKPDTGANQLTDEDLEICHRLDQEYDRALEEREIGYNARYASVRQSAVLSICFMVAFLSLGTVFFMRQAAWTLPESLLFSIYTITTVGYGRNEMPTTPSWQLYVIFYILVGVGGLTVLVAQVYQCIALEASRAQHARDKTEMKRRGLDLSNPSLSQASSLDPGSTGEGDSNEIIDFSQPNMPGTLDLICRCYDRAKKFFQHNEIGKGISVIFPFAGLILVGALVVGPLEEWTFLEAIYFSVVSLTTVGFGDYQVQHPASIYFCLFWLPFSIGFMSMYLTNVASFYIRLSDRNTRRIERHMRRRLQRAKDRAELERAEVLRRAYRGQELELEVTAATLGEPKEGVENLEYTNRTDFGPTGIPIKHAQRLAGQQGRSGFDALTVMVGNSTGEFDTSEGQRGHFGSDEVDIGSHRRLRIVENAIISKIDERGARPTMQSMRDVIQRVRSSIVSEGGIRSGPDTKFMSIRSTQTMTTHTSILRTVQTRKPSFALRVLVQERFAQIIATDIAGYQSAFEIKETTMILQIESMVETADKWLIPRRARKPFRAVAFEVLYFVGEHGLVTRGADALFDLSPFEFHGLFSPLIAAMGDADTMEIWLANTDVLAAADLQGIFEGSHEVAKDGPPPSIGLKGVRPTKPSQYS
jgi:Ion channel